MLLAQWSDSLPSCRHPGADYQEALHRGTSKQSMQSQMPSAGDAKETALPGEGDGDRLE